MLLKHAKEKNQEGRGLEAGLLLNITAEYCAHFLMSDAEKMLQLRVGLIQLPQ
jgi:hypothetical protein